MNKFETVASFDKAQSDVKKQVVLYKGEAYTYFDSGLTRHVFVNKDRTKVVKTNIEGLDKDYNKEEVDRFSTLKNSGVTDIAETIYTGNVVEQEFCNPIKFDVRILTVPQMLFAQSCRNEVGWDKDGNLKCFDLDEYKKY